jgi:Integrase zinc binding domain
MAEFDFKLIYKPGTTNKADHLSCHPDYDNGSLNNQDVTILPPHLFIHASTVSDLEQLVLDAQLTHPNLLHLWASCFNLTESDSAWYHGSALVVVEDNELRREVSSLYHDHRLAGHPGISKTLDLLTRDATVGRTCYHACIHMAILRVCDSHALDAMDRGALTVWYNLLFMESLAFYLYDTCYVLYGTRYVVVYVRIGP